MRLYYTENTDTHQLYGPMRDVAEAQDYADQIDGGVFIRELSDEPEQEELEE